MVGFVRPTARSAAIRSNSNHQSKIQAHTSWRKSITGRYTLAPPDAPTIIPASLSAETSVGTSADRWWAEENPRCHLGFSVVGPTGLEPVTSCVSSKRSSRAELRARVPSLWRRRPESNRCDGFCRPAPNHSATSPRPDDSSIVGAEDGIRTRDLNLGKVAL